MTRTLPIGLVSLRVADRRGVALMLVLWVVIVLGAIAAGVVLASRSQSNLVQTVRARTVARYAAESGVVAATTKLKALYLAARGPEDQAAVYLRFEEQLARMGEQPLGSGRYQVAVADLNARIDLNMADDEVLLGLFSQFFGEREASALVDALSDWIDQDDVPRPRGAEARDYEGAGSPFYPPNAPLLRLDELTRINGFSDSIAGVIAPYVTIWSDGRVNVNTAPEEVLASIPGLGPAGAELFISARERDGALPSMIAVRSRLFEAQIPGVGVQLRQLTTVPNRILIVSRGWQEGYPLTHEIQAVFEISGLFLEDGPRFRVRYWTERDL